jgi:uncharacterized protein DUF6893
MSEIRIGSGAQALLLLALLGGTAAAVSTQLPEIRRYLKVRSM